MLMPNRCARCGDCVRACQSQALAQKEDGEVVADRSRCTLCGDCERACQREAISLVGREMSLEEHSWLRSKKTGIFYDQSGGGVTLTGGEPLFQSELAEALIDRLHQAGIKVALDTSGYAPAEVFLRLARKSDLILYDLKVMAESQHKKYTGVSNRLILRNLKALDKLGRLSGSDFPLFPGSMTARKISRLWLIFYSN